MKAEIHKYNDKRTDRETGDGSITIAVDYIFINSSI